MIQKDKELLLKDLCARLPYGVKVKQGEYVGELRSFNKYTISFNSSCAIPKPYLRPISSMTEEEEIEYDATFATIKTDGHYDSTMTYKSFDFLNAHHFDYRGLIPKGLALEAPEGMYGKEEQQ